MNKGLKNIIDHYKNSSIDQPIVFIGKEIEVLILPYNSDHPTMFMRNKKNEHFIELYGNGHSANGNKKSWGFQNVFSEYESYNRFYKLYSEGSIAMLLNSGDHEFMHGKELEHNDLVDLKYVPIPENRIFEYILFNEEKDLYITVDRPEIHWSYEDFRVHIFTHQQTICQNANVLKANRYRDGGTTEIETDLGFLYCPTSFKQDENPTWTPNNEDEKINLSDVKKELIIEQFHVRTGVNNPIIKREK